MFNIFKNKFFDFAVLVLVFIIMAVIFVVSNNITKSKIEIVKKEKYNIYAKNIYDEIEILIKNKKELTFAVALSLSKNDNIIKSLQTNNIQILQLKEFSQILRKTTKLKNAWFQIIDAKGITFYRSWMNKRGDPIIQSRIDVAKMIEQPQTMSTISTGKFDMTFKSMVPIYDKDKFIGMFEIITHFNSIAKQLLDNDIESIILVDKKYRKQLNKGLTQLFIDDYYVANAEVNRMLLEYIKDKGVTNYISGKQNYIIDEKANHFVIIYNIPDIYGNSMGTIIAFKKLDSFNMDDIEYIKTNMIFYEILLLLLLILVGYYFIVKKHTRELDSKVLKRTKELNTEKRYIQTILDTNSSIILVTKNSKITTANKRFLEFFHYESLEDFQEEYECICDMFITLDEIEFPEDKKINGELWSEYLVKNPYQEHFVVLEFKNEEFTFIINGSYLKKNGDILLTLQNITELKKKDKLLFEQTKMASMGEMIGNIAHQWRQPLSIISTGATGMKLQKRFGNLTDDYFDETCDVIDSNAQYLSKTIDDFRDFIKGNRKKEQFTFENLIEKLIHLIKPSLNSHQIELIVDVEENIQFNGYLNELVQCLINLFNNAKDALKEQDENDRLIFITSSVVDENINITIKDSGGGIDPSFLSKIFDPYFTTKHPSMGTGLGLHMTYNLIVDGMHGSIDVENSDYKYHGKNYRGAVFSIKLPVE